MERSKHILEGLGNQYYRATLKSMGFTTEDLKRPVIGIANAWSECVPGHYNLRQVAQRVKDGIYRAGGTPIEFGVIGGCDGMGQGHDGMHYILPSRELIANSIESMAQINLFDGLVLLGSCDKIVPGMLMAAARLDIPCIFLPGGPMEGGVVFDGRQADQTSSTIPVRVAAERLDRFLLIRLFFQCRQHRGAARCVLLFFLILFRVVALFVHIQLGV